MGTFFNKYNDKIEKIQRKFLRFVAFKLGMPTDRLDYAALELNLGIQTLSRRRRNADVIFCHKVMHGLVDCPNILSQLNFYVPPRLLRENRSFELQQHRTLYGQNSVVNRIMKHANDFIGDLFLISHGSLRCRLKSPIN